MLPVGMLPVPMHNHAMVQGANLVTAGGGEQERKNAVDQAGHATPEHPHCEGRRRDEMLAVGFADGGRVFDEVALENLHGCISRDPMGE